ncbi:MAG TPA: hypothetical protein VGJ57_03365 [Nitrospirales bacterium]|jgi:hypothetical protein
MKTLRVMLTRAELIAAHLAIGLTWIEHRLDLDPDAKPLWRALKKFNTALDTWECGGTANLVSVGGGALKEEGIKTAMLPSQAKVKKEILVQWNCFCHAPNEACRYCRGSGHIKRWMPARLVGYLKDTTYMIVARRDEPKADMLTPA